jgi:hypothetical protein
VASAGGAAGAEGAAVSAAISEMLSTDKAVIVASDTAITVTNNITTDAIAEKINEEHRLAHSAAETAVAHAVRCGQLLIQQRKAMNHGEFMPWVKKNCEFSHATANRYMKAGQNPHAVGISLRHLFPSGRKPNGSRAVVREVGVDESAASKMTIDDAMCALRRNHVPSYSPLLYGVTNGRAQVTKLRNKLRDAEKKLAEAEKAVIAAASKVAHEFRS